MRLTREEFEEKLNTLGVQVFYNHTTQKDVVDFPFIVYMDDGTQNFVADNYVNQEITDYAVIVHTYERNNQVVEDLKTLLNENRIPWEINDVDWNDTIMAYSISFNVYL